MEHHGTFIFGIFSHHDNTFKTHKAIYSIDVDFRVSPRYDQISGLVVALIFGDSSVDPDAATATVGAAIGDGRWWRIKQLLLR